jgi:hypothetical protein
MEAVEELDAWKRELVQLHLFKTRVQEEQAELADGMEKYERRRQVGNRKTTFRQCFFAWIWSRISVRFGGSGSALNMSRVEPVNVCFFVPSFAIDKSTEDF